MTKDHYMVCIQNIYIKIAIILNIWEENLLYWTNIVDHEYNRPKTASMTFFMSVAPRHFIIWNLPFFLLLLYQL